MAALSAADSAPAGFLVPAPHRVRSRLQESADTWTLELEPLAEVDVPLPGQFAMLYARGVGEVPISVSARGGDGRHVHHTVRAVGHVTRALCAIEAGSFVGVRGPFGSPWPLAAIEGRDVVVIAGGIGLAPLRPAVHHVLAAPSRYRSATVLVGARTPSDLLFADEFESWVAGGGCRVLTTVDAASTEWRGMVGPVTGLVPPAVADRGADAAALVCGPELMMRLAARRLVEHGVRADRIWLSLERNMPCGVGLCGHCQLGHLIICRDGPVLRYDQVRSLLEVPEL